MMTEIQQKCVHGKFLFPKAERCIECEIVWEQEAVVFAEERLAKARKRIIELHSEQKDERNG